MYSGEQFDFYSCDFLKLEIARHKSKILQITKYTNDEFYEIEFLVTKNITFTNHMLIDAGIQEKAEKMLEGIDIDDAPFLALTKQMRAKLWTGDKRLSNALIKQGYKDICTTEQLLLKLKS